MEETISLKELMQTLRKRLNLILVITLIAVLISGIISFFFLTPIYQASTQILVNQTKNDQASYNVGEVQTNLQLINTYNVIIKSPAILDLVSKELDLDMAASELNGKINVQSQQNSQVVNITVQDPDAKKAADIANKTAEVFQREIVKIMNVDNVSILAKATIVDNQSPIKPKPLLNIAIALVVGLMAGVGIAFLIEYLDNTIKTEQDIEKVLGMPVLGVVATISDTKERASRQESNSRVRGESHGK
ncbi:YveK family protein [Mesobacillus jeotgali]|uniref:YveK family protein n=1 Tax=Mesobacillus jeotgali TaxID=129985 RepID=UPI000C8419BB|nr:YveK family protein [Mesobacillus jeotgali]